MKNTIIPWRWKVDQLELVAYHRYTSHTTDSVIEIDKTSVEPDDRNTNESIKWFNALRERVMKSYIDMGDDVRTRVWDNKVVIECKTNLGNTIYVGYYDWFLYIGFGVRSDSHVKPYPFVPKPAAKIIAPDFEDAPWPEDNKY